MYTDDEAAAYAKALELWGDYGVRNAHKTLAKLSEAGIIVKFPAPPPPRYYAVYYGSLSPARYRGDVIDREEGWIVASFRDGNSDEALAMAHDYAKKLNDA